MQFALLIFRYVRGMLPYMAIACPAFAVWRLVAVKVRLKRQAIRTTAHHEIGTLLFSLFLVGLASQTVLNGIAFFGGRIYIATASFPTEPYYNLRPFRVLFDTWKLVRQGVYSSLLINFVGNIAMFVPIGFFIPLLHGGVSMKKAVLIGLCTSLTIEVLQIPFSWRCSDIDDLWLNTLGAFLGYLLYGWMQTCFPALAMRFKVRPSTSAPIP